MSISSSATRYNIEPLKANNYVTWKDKMKIILIKEKTWNIVSGKTPNPVWTPPAPAEDEEPADPSDTFLQQLQQWEDKAEDAVASITLAIDST
jgi:hypothetical protein